MLKKMLQCRVNFLDDTHFMWELERNAVGQDLFNKVCEHLDLLERDYYGLAMWDSPNTRVWLDRAKEIRKQIKGSVAEFFFNIKFYPPDPSSLAEDITRYLLCLQLRKDIMTGRLPCQLEMLALLGSYTVQSTLGDYDPNLHKDNYVREVVLAPNQSEELEERVMEQYSTHRSMSPAQADMLFLEYAKTLPMYGVDLHPAKDVTDADVMLGVCSEGLMVYEDEIKINSFPWSTVLKISHKRNIFLLKMRPFEQDESDVRFTLASYRACKQLWKCSVESHSFFRNRLQDSKAKRFLTVGSRFRYHGRTQSECLEASANISRSPPQFLRHAIKSKENEEILKVLKQPVRTESDDWFLVHDSDKWDISTSGDVVLESKQLWESKQQADDWFVLLESSLFSLSGVQELHQTEAQREVEIVEEKESQDTITDERVTKHSYKVHVAQEGPVELKVMEELAKDILEKEHPELKEQIMGTMKESLTEEILEVNGERIQRVVITKQWTQEVNSYVESQEDVEKKTEKVETVKRHVVVTKGGKLLDVGSEETSERLENMERRLQEVEAIEQKLLDVDVLRVGLQEVESLEQRLQQAEREGLKQVETADWYILLDRSPSMLSAVLTAEEEWQQTDIRKPMERNDDWYILLEMIPQTTKLTAPPTDVISSMAGEDQHEEESRKVEKIKLEQEPLPAEKRLLPAEKPKTQAREEASVELYEETREEVIQSTVRIEEEQKELHEQKLVDYRRPQPEQKTDQTQRDLEDDWFILLDVSPEKSVRGTAVDVYEESREDVLVRAAQHQRDAEDDWFIILDVSPKVSVALSYPQLQSTTVDLYEESREEPEISVRTEKVEYKQQQQQVTVDDRRPQQAVLEQRSARTQREIEDDWSIILDVSPKEAVPLAYPRLRETTVELYEESRVSRMRREEQVIEVMTVSTGQTVITEKKSVIQTPESAVVPRELDDDWFQLFDQVPYEQRSFLPEARFVQPALLDEEKRAVERKREEEVQKKQQQQVTVEDRRAELVILDQRTAQTPRDREDDWSIILDVSPKVSVPTTVELYDGSREEVLESRMRRGEQVITISTGQTMITEKKTMRVVQTAQEFPVVPREIDDDWFQMFDPVPYEQRSFPAEIKSRDIDVREPTKDQRVQRIVDRVVEEPPRVKSVTTEERRVLFEERRERVDIVQHMFPVGVREVDDDWFELLDPTPFEKRAVSSVATEEQRLKEQKEVRQQDRRIRDDVESRMRQQEIRKQELEARKVQPAVIIVQTVSQREVEDDWFVLFDVAPKPTVVADVIKVDKRGMEVRRREEERRHDEESRREEERRREEEKRRQIKVEDRQKRPAAPEKIPVWQQRKVEDDWFTLLSVSHKESVPTLVPVISPVALPKPRPQIPADQPLTSTPTVQPVSVTKTTYQNRTKDTLDITLESEAEESVLLRKSRRWTKRIEGESIYVRHSILMLEDFDVTQEVILRHHASISELKRIFMEGMPDFGPTEWDRRLSSYSPMPKAQLPHANGEILTSMGLIGETGKTVL